MNKLLLLSSLPSTAVIGCNDSGVGTKPATDPPPTWGVPITGGMMLVTKDGLHAYIADPDRDRIAVLDLDTGATKDIALQAHDEPGRLIEDGADASRSRCAAAARSSPSRTTRSPRAARSAPSRAVLAWDSATDLVHRLGCATGEPRLVPGSWRRCRPQRVRRSRPSRRDRPGHEPSCRASARRSSSRSTRTAPSSVAPCRRPCSAST